ncbi:MAG: diacylglycerol kinase family protein, partial [Micrococcaceae bacterium]
MFKSLASKLAIATAISASAALSKLSSDAFLRVKTRSPATKPAQAAPQGKHRVGVVINPSKNRYEEAKATIEDACREKGWPAPKFWETTIEDPGTKQTQAALKADCDLILVCGGDGTVRKCSEELLETDIPMGIVPIGSGNLFSRNLRLLTLNLRKSVDTALFGKERYVDVGHVQLDGGEREIWLVMTGLGADGYAISITKPKLKKYLSWVAYLESGARSIMDGRRDKVSVTIDDQEPFEANIRSIMGANCSILPGQVDLIPEAVIDDGVMNIMILSPRTPWGWLNIGTRILLQAKRPEGIFTMVEAKSLTVESENPIQAQIDGDFAGEVQKMELTIAPSSLKVKVPQKRAKLPLDMILNTST